MAGYLRQPLEECHLLLHQQYRRRLDANWPSVGADDAHEHLDPGIRKGDSPVMLSAAKHLSAHHDRPFAEFTLSATHGLRVTVEGPMYRPQWLFRNPDEKALFAPTMQTRQNML